MKGLTEKQREVMHYLSRAIERDERPTVREVADALGITPSLVHRRMQALQDKRYIHRRHGTRDIQIIRK